MGLKEPGLRGSLRNVSVGINAIPDTGLSHDYNAEEEPIGELATWTDQVGAEDLTAGVAPTVVDDGINNNKSVRFDDTDDLLTAQTNSNWNFLHDGSEFSAYFVVEANGTDDFNSIASTTDSGGVVAGDLGFTLARDDRDDAGFNDHIRVIVVNGSDDVIRFEVENEFPQNTPRIYSVRFDGTDQYTINREKTGLGTPTASNHTTDNADNPLSLGRLAMDSDVGRQLYYNIEHDGETHNQVIDALANQFDISI